MSCIQLPPSGSRGGLRSSDGGYYYCAEPEVEGELGCPGETDNNLPPRIHPCKPTTPKARPPRLTSEFRPSPLWTKTASASIHPPVTRPSISATCQRPSKLVTTASPLPQPASHSRSRRRSRRRTHTFTQHRRRPRCAQIPSQHNIQARTNNPYVPSLIDPRNLTSPWRNHIPPSSTSPSRPPTRTLPQRCRELLSIAPQQYWSQAPSTALSLRPRSPGALPGPVSISHSQD